jgi:hypothetical protein
MTDSSGSDGDAAGISRRRILKKSAIIGGTALWVAPTVLTITASPAFASVRHPGDGSPLCADSYLLLLRCGSVYYLVKIVKDPQDKSKLKVIGGRELFAEDDAWHSKPGNRNKETDVSRLRKRYNISVDLPVAPSYYTTKGGLCVDLGRIRVMDPVVKPHKSKHGHSTPTATPTPSSHFENSCSVVTWIVASGRTYGSQLTTPSLGPSVADKNHQPQITCFPCCRRG